MMLRIGHYVLLHQASQVGRLSRRVYIQQKKKKQSKFSYQKLQYTTNLSIGINVFMSRSCHMRLKRGQIKKQKFRDQFGMMVEQVSRWVCTDE